MYSPFIGYGLEYLMQKTYIKAGGHGSGVAQARLRLKRRGSGWLPFPIRDRKTYLGIYEVDALVDKAGWLVGIPKAL